MWNYNEKVMDHFLNPRNVGTIENPDAEAEVGNMTCGDALKITIRLDDEKRISDIKFQTFGCASAIASSSVLTELVKGLTLDEAAKITNRNIADALGELPEEKMHCSVMGMEALQAAIVDYKKKHGEPYEELEVDETDHEGRIICHCFGITDAKIRKVAKINNLHTVEEITEYTKAGGACGMCLDSIQEILDEMWAEPAPVQEDSFDSLSLVKKILRVQEVIDKEIKPALERDGGSIELIDLEGKVVHVRLKGMCAACPNASLTLKKLVEGKLQELVCADLQVEEVK